jgi:membrane protein insertase Oxa1/YidC/SpoIIIJ
MTAVRESLSPKRHKSQDKNSSSRSLNNTNNSSQSSERKVSGQSRSQLKQKSSVSVSSISNKKFLTNLKVLRFFQQSSSVLAFSLVIVTLLVYVSSFYLPQKWSKQYKQLTILQRQERELTRVNESLKKQLAQQAQRPDSGLESFDPTKAIFIEPAKNSSNKATKDKSNSNTLFDRVPLGY